MVPSRGGRDAVVRRYDWTADAPSVAVIDAIARYEGVGTQRMAEQLNPALRDTLDTDALDTLISSCPSLVVSFRCADYVVHLANERVVISHVMASIT